MINHSVMIKLIDMPDSEKKEKLNRLKSELENLKEKIPEIIYIEAGINISDRPITFDLLASSQFKSQEDLDIFRFHPAHLEVVEFIKTIEKQSILVDYIS